MHHNGGPAWWWWLACWAIPTGIAITLALVLGHSSLDVRLMEPFHDATAGGFPLRHQWFFAVVLHTTAKWLAVLTPVIAALVFGASWRWTSLRAWRWPALYLALCAGGTAALVGVIRLMTNRYSPWAIDVFGGEVPWTPLFSGTPAPFSDGHSFPAAHAAGAFAWLSLWFVGRHFESSRLWWWLLPGSMGGLLFAWTQHVRGEHFPSHNFWTIAIAWTVACGLAALASWCDLIPQAPVRSPIIRPERPMIPTRSWLIGTTGMLVGCLLFSIDTTVEHLHIGPDNLHFWIECAEFTVIGPGLGVLCLLLAERLRVLHIATVAQQRAERERRFLMLGRMAASVAHEVRNPLHTLRLVVDELRVEQPALRSHPLSRDIDDSMERIDRAVDLVYQLARPGTEDEGTSDVVLALRDAHSALTRQLGERTITYAGLPERAAVRCSASGLRIMVDNLLRNAVQATTLSDVIMVNLRSERSDWILAISNPGELPASSGLRDDELPAASSKADGLGLGLTITRHLAANASGALAFTCVHGVVTATLTLPVWKEASP